MLGVCRIAGAMMPVRMRGVLGRLSPTRQLRVLGISGLGRRRAMSSVIRAEFLPGMAVCTSVMGVVRHRRPMLVVVFGVVSVLALSDRLAVPAMIAMIAVSIVHSPLR
jgi:hypothetical protein